MKHGFAVVAVLPLLAACGGAAAGSPSPARSVAPAASATPLAFPMAGLNEGAGRVTGMATVEEAAGGFTLTVRLTGLAAGSTHVAHIHHGSCAAGGGIALAVASLVADAGGNAISTTTFGQDFHVPAEGWYVNVHAGPDLSTPASARAVACADLRAS